ncbi:hypothetical protein [Cecembia lonarensis]|nr:hypothetical protein [Cecembia lonarensis]
MKTELPNNSFSKDPETEIARRLKHAKSLTREEFSQGILEIRRE